MQMLLHETCLGEHSMEMMFGQGQHLWACAMGYLLALTIVSSDEAPALLDLHQMSRLSDHLADRSSRCSQDGVIGCEQVVAWKVSVFKILVSY
jgi:hypothetical protein